MDTTGNKALLDLDKDAHITGESSTHLSEDWKRQTSKAQCAAWEEADVFY